jgi:hypothetical protein
MSFGILLTATGSHLPSYASDLLSEVLQEKRLNQCAPPFFVIGRNTPLPILKIKFIPLLSPFLGY